MRNAMVPPQVCAISLTVHHQRFHSIISKEMKKGGFKWLVLLTK